MIVSVAQTFKFRNVFPLFNIHLILQGDYLAKGVSLPESIKTGDILIIHDTGANAMSMYSKFNSNIPNPVYGFSVISQKIFCFKEREILTETLAFWGSKHPRLI